MIDTTPARSPDPDFLITFTSLESTIVPIELSSAIVSAISLNEKSVLATKSHATAAVPLVDSLLRPTLISLPIYAMIRLIIDN